MKFAPRPENDFAEYIRTYYRACRSHFDKIEAIAGKWMYRDLCPGMSDFDTRFITSDDMAAGDWCRMSTAIGEVHRKLCEKYPCWARNLEHLPGINLTWEELEAERSYYPEYQQWTYYHGEAPEKIEAVLDRLEKRRFDREDEYFHLKKFCLYYGRYNRSIDPAINLGVHENKYPLHSRIMHYFCPPVMSAVCLVRGQNICGKLDSFEVAEILFPDLRCWAMVREILHANYEIPKWYQEPYLSDLEDALEEALLAIAGRLREVITLVPQEAGVDIAVWEEILRKVPRDPGLVLLESARFSRLMKGRLHFYVHAPAHFDADWLIRNELGRIGEGFFRVPFRTFWRIKTGEEIEDPVAILNQLEGEMLSAKEVAATRQFAHLTTGHCPKGKRRETAAAIVDVFDDFYKALHKIGQVV